MNRQHEIGPYWQDEDDWLCTIEFLPGDDPEGRLAQTSSVISLATNTRVLALIGNPDATTYALLLSFSTPGDKDQFLDLVRSNEHLGTDYTEDDSLSPKPEEIRNARPLVAVVPEDIVSRATLIVVASVLGASSEGGP